MSLSSWTVRSTPSNNQWSCITYGAGKFVALSIEGSSSSVMTSTDGITWTVGTAPAKQWAAICYGGGQFVACASDGFMTSPDGITWRDDNQVRTSPDGIIWTMRTTGAVGSWRSITFGNGIFVVVQPTGWNQLNNVQTSPDGITWTMRDSSTVGRLWTSVCFGNGLFVAVARNTDGDLRNVMTSPDGINWTIRMAAASLAWSSVTYGNGFFVAVAQTGSGSRAMSSPDGINWTLAPSTPEVQWNAVGYGNGTFAAVAMLYTTTRPYYNVMTASGISPTLTNFSVPSKELGDPPFALTAPTSNSTGAFTYSSDNLAVATIRGNIVTIQGGGVATIRATQEPTASYASGYIDAPFSVQANPVLGPFVIPSAPYLSPPVTITPPTSNSPGAFTYTSSNRAVADVSGNTLIVYTVGSTVVRAIQAPAPGYNAAYTDTTFTVVKANPTLGAFSVPTKKYGDAPFSLTAPSSNSAGTFSYSSSNVVVATVSGSTVTITGVGSCVITATQASTPLFNAGSTTAIFTVNKGDPVLGPFSIPDFPIASQQFTMVPPSSTSTGSFVYQSSNTSVATVSGDVVTCLAASTCTITATQLATARYNSASISASLTITPTYQATSSTAFNSFLTSNQSVGNVGTGFVLLASDPTWTSPQSKTLLSTYPQSAKISKSISSTPMWILQTPSAINGFTSVTYGNGLFAAVAYTGVYSKQFMTSPDGITWTARASPASNFWGSVAYGNGTFVAVASTGTNRVAVSTNGISWAGRAVANAYPWVSVVYGNGMFVALSQYQNTSQGIMTSPDGITWTSRTTPNFRNTTFASIAYGNGMFIAIATSAPTNILKSSNGITWTNATANASKDWRSITFGAGKFVAVANASSGTTGTVMTSTDGINWTSYASAAANCWTSVVYGGGKFVAVSNTGSQNSAMESVDGTSWTSMTTPLDGSTNNAWSGIAFGNNTFAAVASSGGSKRVMALQM